MDSCEQALSLRAKNSKQKLDPSLRKNISAASVADSVATSAAVVSVFSSVVFGLYQYILSPILHIFGAAQAGACRYPLRCSEYSKQALEKKGVIKGLILSILRILSCNPWMKPNAKFMSIGDSPNPATKGVDQT